MSRLVARILLSMMMFPLAGMLYLIVFIASDSILRHSGFGGRDTEMFLMADIVTWGAIAAYWVMLWRASIVWTTVRIWQTIGAALASAVIGMMVGLLAGATLNGGREFGYALFVGGVVAILLWLICTVLVWRETALERTRRVTSSSKGAIVCPACGYNLTGLNELRCPECGAKFTIDELMAGQPERGVAVVEAE